MIDVTPDDLVGGRTALAGALTDAGLTVDPADLDVQMLSGGRSNVTLLVRSATDRWVLRRPPMDIGPGTQNLLRREVRVLRALEQTAIPAPCVLADWTDENALGFAAYLMSFSDGSILERWLSDEMHRPHLDTEPILASMVDVLAAIHAVPVDEVGLADWRRPGDFLARRLARWTEVWSSAAPAGPVALELARALTDSVPQATPSTLVHGDFRPGNLVVDPGSGEITSVLDWEMSTVGDPLTDLGFLVAYTEPVAGIVSHRGQQALPRLVPDGELRLAERYAEATGRRADHLAWYVAEEHWKTAAVLQIVADRDRRGATVGSGFEDLDASIHAHLTSASTILRS